MAVGSLNFAQSTLFTESKLGMRCRNQNDVDPSSPVLLLAPLDVPRYVTPHEITTPGSHKRQVDQQMEQAGATSWRGKCRRPGRRDWPSLEGIHGTFVVATLAGLLSIELCGCAHHTYSVAEIPPGYSPPPTENAQVLDLSRLASPTSHSDLVEVGDVLEITMETGYREGRQQSFAVRVRPDGLGDVPLVGPVRLQGLVLEAAEQAIAAASVERGVFREPHITATIKQPRLNRVTVVGAVETPGVFELRPGDSSLLAALVAAGGLNDKATPQVEIRRAADTSASPPPGEGPHLAGQPPVRPASFGGSHGPPRSEHINLVSLVREGRAIHPLADGDVVMVRNRDPQPVHVLGLVNKPGQFEMPVNRDLRMLDVLAMAGGVSTPLSDKVYVIRQSEEQPPIVIALSIRDAKLQGEDNLRLAPGDIVSVEQTPLTAAVDILRSFVRVGVSATSSLPLF